MPPQNFALIIGAPKSGTSSLVNWLSQRSDTAVCAYKEPNYFTDFSTRKWSGPAGDIFSDSIVRTEADYFKEFQTDARTKWLVDGSTDYLWCDASAELIHSFSARFPTKLICILRDPVDRAVSEYQHTIRDGLESQSLLGSLQAEESRRAQNWQPLFYHKRRGQYFKDVTRYKEIFGPDLLILDYHALGSPAECLEKVEAFLGMSHEAIDTSERRNVSHVYRSRLAGRIAHSRSFENVARTLIPKPFRRSMRRILDYSVKRKYVPTKAEIATIKEALHEDIVACVGSDFILTSHWTRALD